MHWRSCLVYLQAFGFVAHMFLSIWETAAGAYVNRWRQNKTMQSISGGPVPFHKYFVMYIYIYIYIYILRILADKNWHINILVGLGFIPILSTQIAQKLTWILLFQFPIDGILTLSKYSMMTSSNGNIFRVTDPLCGEITGLPQRPVTRGFDVFFDLRLNKSLSKQWWGWWFETLSSPLQRHCNAHPQSTPVFSWYWGQNNQGMLLMSRLLVSANHQQSIIFFWS